MQPVTIADSEFEAQPSTALLAAAAGPIVITEGGRPAYVLMSYEHFQRVSKQPVDALAAFSALPENGELDFEPPRLELPLDPASLD